jgi:hypothetical protein
MFDDKVVNLDERLSSVNPPLYSLRTAPSNFALQGCHSSADPDTKDGVDKSSEDRVADLPKFHYVTGEAIHRLRATALESDPSAPQ